ncbi:MAG: BCCT family transporter [Nanoarchaeota archaeon]
MFSISAVLVILFVIRGIAFTFPFEQVMDAVHDAINKYLGRFLILCATIFLVFSLYLAMSRFRNYRLTPDNSKPLYSFFTWIAMLFSAGMGIRLLVLWCG